MVCGHLDGRFVVTAAGREPRDHEERVLRFLPRLDPLARTLDLTFRGVDEEVRVSLDLG
jgi:hypothetical protein